MLFGQRIQPVERIAKAAFQREKLLKAHGIKKYNKRFRAWAQHRVRQYTLGRPVSLFADPAEMNGEYLASAMQKAAALRKHDLQLWGNLSKRTLEIVTEIKPEHLGYIFYGIGKSRYFDATLVRKLFSHLVTTLPKVNGHCVMAAMWTLRRTQIKPNDDELVEVAKWLIQNKEKVRPKDFMKITHSLAFFGSCKNNEDLRVAISVAAVYKFENETFAQDFRSAINPMTLANLYTDSVRKYALNRFVSIAVCARPQHLLRAYEAAVLIRVMRPKLWFELYPRIRKFYTSLAMRYVEAAPKRMTKLHREISEAIENKLGLKHRLAFRWGPFYVDIGFDGEDDRNACLMVDNLSSFYFDSMTYTEEVKVNHKVLTELGWDVRRVNWADWVMSDDRAGLLRTILAAPAVSVVPEISRPFPESHAKFKEWRKSRKNLEIDEIDL